MKLFLLCLLLASGSLSASLGKRYTNTQEIDPALEKEFERKELEKKKIADEVVRRKKEEAKKKEQEKIVEELKALAKKAKEKKVTIKKTEVKKVEHPPKPPKQISPPVIKYEPKKAEAVRKTLRVFPKGGEYERKNSQAMRVAGKSSWALPGGGSSKTVVNCPKDSWLGEHRLLLMRQDHVSVYTPRLSCKESVENCEVNYKNNKKKIGYRCYWNELLVFWKEAEK